MYILYSNSIVKKYWRRTHIPILIRRKGERIKKRLHWCTRQRQSGYLALLLRLRAFTLAPAAAWMSGRAKYYPAAIWCLRSHCAVRDYLTTCVPCSLRDKNRIARLPASAHFPEMAAATEIRRPGWCRPCRRFYRVVVTRRSQQNSRIHDGSRFGKFFLVSNLW